MPYAPVTDPNTRLARTERHVREGEERAAHQRAIIGKLERDGHRNAARKVRKLLSALEKSLRLAREHLCSERETAQQGLGARLGRLRPEVETPKPASVIDGRE
ncbi:MAG: hypothetical protein ACRD4Q_02180 [Candidatus Acidiferrales bacterium]